ncbi:hypothetical protein AYO40_03850 [Planctomycetaceae bacterium SCGC AG-212-D15]|nr:hypothetical protein AYO40_03850 [Planctomycetaceae bacterium SCGC AG-212-D15]
MTVRKDDKIKLLKSTGRRNAPEPLTISMSDMAIELKAGSSTTSGRLLEVLRQTRWLVPLRIGGKLMGVHDLS